MLLLAIVTASLLLRTWMPIWLEVSPAKVLSRISVLFEFVSVRMTGALLAKLLCSTRSPVGWNRPLLPWRFTAPVMTFWVRTFWPAPLAAPVSVKLAICDRPTVTVLAVAATVTVPRFRLVSVTWLAWMFRSYRGRMLPGTLGSPSMVRPARVTLTVPASGVAPGSTTTVPFTPANGMASASEWRCVTSTAWLSGTT